MVLAPSILQLLKCSSTVEHIFRCLNAEESALSIYLDIAKSIDTINHNAVCLKLTHFGFDNKFLGFFADYLSNRTQCVCLKVEYLSELTVTSGPQCSRFAMYINNLSSLIENSTSLFCRQNQKNWRSVNLFLLQNDANKAIK